MGGIDKKNVILAITILLAYANTAESIGNCKDAACPPYNGSSILVPHPTECESFCVCTCDGAIYMPCPAGLHYNEECHMCDWPSHAGCDPSPQPTTPSGGTTSSGGGGGGTTSGGGGGGGTTSGGGGGGGTTSGGGGGGGTTSGGGSGGGGSCDKVKPLCPPTNVGNATLLPNPDDCGSYCICDWGNAILMPCPAGLHFNPVLQVCDYPENAGCDPSAKPSTPSGGTTSGGGGGGGTTSGGGGGGGSTSGGGGGGGTTSGGGSGGGGSCDKVKPLCPPTNVGNATLLPNPDDCGSYCICDWGNAILMPCPAGLHFNPVLQVCDYPENAGCDPSAKPSTPSGGTTSGGGGGGGTTSGGGGGGGSTSGGGGGGGTTSGGGSGGGGSCDKVKPLCPPTNVGNATLLPNPDDCGSYCVCDWGNAILMPCPAGLHFNPVLQVCDYPENAGCDPSAKPSTPSGGTTSGGGGGGGTTSGGGGGGGSTSGGGGGGGTTSGGGSGGSGSCDKVKPLCPPTNVGNATLLPNPDDCGSYCVCDWGNAILMPCPAGLHFNPVLQVCDYPENAGCDPSAKPSTPSGGTTSSGGGGGGTTSGGGGGGGSTSGGGGGGGTTSGGGSGGSGSCDKVKPLCPPTNVGNATLLPNPDDCGSFCICDWGNAILMPCPAGLHFNPALQVCDYPENAGCDPSAKPSTPSGGTTSGGGGGGGTTSGGGGGGGSTSGGGGGGGTTSGGGSGGGGSCDKVKPLCPPTNVGNATLLPNPDDCGSFCMCDWGNAIWKPCPAGLHFNPVLKVCDYPENAGCDPSAKPSTPSGGTTSGGGGGGGTTSDGGSSGGGTTISPPGPTGPCGKLRPLCPPVNGVNATLLPNPEDCGSYCKCDWGRIFFMPCPDGLHFNPTLKVCDYPDQAGCITNT